MRAVCALAWGTTAANTSPVGLGERDALGLAVDPDRDPAGGERPIRHNAVPSLPLRWAAAVRPAIRTRVPAGRCAVS